MRTTRRRVMRYLEAAVEPVSVAELAAAFGLPENTVRHHLSALERAGLAESEVRHRGERGRPRLVFRARPAPGDPYEHLARALLRARSTGESLVEAGAAVAPAGDDVVAFLAAEGFGPRPEADGVILTRCPLADAVADDPATVCGVHRGLVSAIAERAGLTAELRAGQPGDCHVRLKSRHPGE